MQSLMRNHVFSLHVGNESFGVVVSLQLMFGARFSSAVASDSISVGIDASSPFIDVGWIQVRDEIVGGYAVRHAEHRVLSPGGPSPRCAASAFQVRGVPNPR
jgi:hypothetical protein